MSASQPRGFLVDRLRFLGLLHFLQRHGGNGLALLHAEGVPDVLLVIRFVAERINEYSGIPTATVVETIKRLSLGVPAFEDIQLDLPKDFPYAEAFRQLPPTDHDLSDLAARLNALDDNGKAETIWLQVCRQWPAFATGRLQFPYRPPAETPPSADAGGQRAPEGIEKHVERIAEAVGDETTGQILAIAHRTDWSGERKMQEILKLDRRFAGKDSAQWGSLLQVTPDAVRGYATWKRLQAAKRLPE